MVGNAKEIKRKKCQIAPDKDDFWPHFKIMPVKVTHNYSVAKKQDGLQEGKGKNNLLPLHRIITL